ncbi:MULTISPECIES: CotH kinase family protein [Microbacterium]|uniref:CotH kinase family protein n=1 Tax=Microbacterium TaxID=33882 RepID=UPI00168B3EFB|nr:MULTISPECIES: CotH kinase family protein [Microbacterium]QOC26646.1 CotH kinase family protein [Microbacterium hominis]QYF97027.1 CotH kinase family protein [Microbacterium sp. PAMC21962]
MTDRSRSRVHPSRRVLLPVTAVVLTLGLAGCGSLAALDTVSSMPTSTGVSSETVVADASGSLWDTSTVHTVSVQVDADALSDMLATYLSAGDKEWLTATVTIDGVAYENVGIKLKGNSTLKGITSDSDASTLPWRIRLDKYVDGQNASGVTDFTIRANSSSTSMNEAVALDALSAAGLASEKSAATRFSVNGGTEVLRLSVQALNDSWVDENFPDAGADSVLYKANADGNWDWAGADGDYSASFDIEAGAEDYAPLVTLLDLVNNGTADEIAEKLPTLLDVDSFATYLALEEAIDNFDDISGPGNNAYLFWDSSTQRFTVVAWDHNLAFGVQNVGGGGQGGGAAPGGGRAPGGQADGGAAGGGGVRGGASDNPLVTAFEANSTWAQLIAEKKTQLQQTLVANGTLSTSVDAWTALLTAQAGDLVDASTVQSDAAAILSAAGA